MTNDGPPTSEDALIERLKMIQSVIDRMAKSPPSLDWSAGLVAALIVLVRLSHDLWFGLLGLIPILILGLLDCYYLGAERKFRGFYAKVIDDTSPTPPMWTMNPWFAEPSKQSNAWATALDGMRVTTVGFAGAFAVVLILVAVLPT